MDVLCEVYGKAEGEEIDCHAVPGSAGGVQLLAEPSAHPTRSALEKYLGSHPPRAENLDDQWLDLVRFYGLCFPLPINWEKGTSRYYFNVPSEGRETGLLPHGGGHVVILVSGTLVELWDAKEWGNRVRQIRERFVELVSRCHDELRLDKLK
jgi:hypothetical protein